MDVREFLAERFGILNLIRFEKAAVVEEHEFALFQPHLRRKIDLRNPQFLPDAEHGPIQAVGHEEQLRVALGFVGDAVEDVTFLHGVFQRVRARLIGEELRQVQFAEHRPGVIPVRTLRIPGQEGFGGGQRFGVLLVAPQIADSLEFLGRQIGCRLSGRSRGFNLLGVLQLWLLHQKVISSQPTAGDGAQQRQDHENLEQLDHGADT